MCMQSCDQIWSNIDPKWSTVNHKLVRGLPVMLIWWHAQLPYWSNSDKHWQKLFSLSIHHVQSTTCTCISYHWASVKGGAHMHFYRCMNTLMSPTPKYRSSPWCKPNAQQTIWFVSETAMWFVNLVGQVLILHWYDEMWCWSDNMLTC